MSWLDDLEARLETELESFLRSNPSQQALLQEQEQRDRLERLRRQRLELQEEAELSRTALLQLASEIRCWQERVERARRAGATELAGRAEAHVATLMDQGRQRWQALSDLGQRFSRVEWELSQLERPAGQGGSEAAPTASGGSGDRPDGDAVGDEADLRDAWAAFEAQQDLEHLKQQLKR